MRRPERLIPVVGVGLVATTALAAVALAGTSAPALGVVPAYDRAAFGPAWQDTDRNGCDQRNDVLARDLTEVVRTGFCTVVSGQLSDPYSDLTVSFVRQGGYQPVQIDHVRALKDAWNHGAYAWSAGKRLAYATDERNLLPTTLNSTKGDSEPAELAAAETRVGNKWRPSAAGECRYAATYVLTSARWELPVDSDDAAALAETLQRCP